MSVYLDKDEEAARLAAKDEQDREYSEQQRIDKLNAKGKRQKADKVFNTVWWTIVAIVLIIVIVRWCMI